MGDVYEVLLTQNQANCFYKITSSAFKFEVKSPLPLCIFLSSTKGSKYDYKISLGDNGNARSWIEHHNDRHFFPSPYVLNANEFTKFWITWYGGFVRLGHNEHILLSVPIADDTSNLQYISFKVQRSTPLRMEMSPIEVKQNLKCFDEGLPEWKECTDQLPPGAAIGGFEMEPLYLIRARHRGSVMPGKFVPSEGTAYVAWGGAAHDKENFEVLCGYNFRWVGTSKDRLPPDAVVGGYSEVGHEPLYIGRARHQNYLIPGKVQLSHKVCYVPFEGQEVAKSEYEVLVTGKCHSRFARAMSPSPDESQVESDDSDDDEETPERQRNGVFMYRND